MQVYAYANVSIQELHDLLYDMAVLVEEQVSEIGEGELREGNRKVKV